MFGRTVRSPKKKNVGNHWQILKVLVQSTQREVTISPSSAQIKVQLGLKLVWLRWAIGSNGDLCSRVNPNLTHKQCHNKREAQGVVSHGSTSGSHTKSKTKRCSCVPPPLTAPHVKCFICSQINFQTVQMLNIYRAVCKYYNIPPGATAFVKKNKRFCCNIEAERKLGDTRNDSPTAAGVVSFAHSVPW